MPYIRKQNVLNDVGWDDDPYSTPKSTLKDRARNDIKVRKARFYSPFELMREPKFFSDRTSEIGLYYSRQLPTY